MPGSRNSNFKLSEIATLIGLAVFIVVIVGMVGSLAWPKIKSNWFPAPTPETDTRPLAMTNEEINNCVGPTDRTILPPATNAGVLIPALQSLVRSGIISELEPILRRIVTEEAVSFWTWSVEGGLLFGISDGPSLTTYMFTILCTTEVGEGYYPLYDTVTVTVSTSGETIGR